MATAQPCFSYDVFLSFRGEDTREGFTGHLFTALNQAGIRTFLDDNGMERGKILKPELDKATHESAISLIVFSEGYASSKWCLDEVLMIVEQYETSSLKQEFIPVFYKVGPSDVRNQRGSFKDAFDAYDDKINAETDLEKKTELSAKVAAWRGSLNKAATFTGLVYKDGMYEAKFITDIVDVIRKKLDYKALYVEEKLVGIEDHVPAIELWLQDLSPDASVLLIDGMGGIGKSTIAKCIFNSNVKNYDGSCFLADINKETSNQPRELVRLQSQLLLKVLKREKEETIFSIDEGIIKVTNALSIKKVLLILDDVATLEQLEALIGPSQRFYPGSKVIITTRHTWLSTTFKDHLKVKVHAVRPLSMGDATKLFSLYAFHQHQPIEPYLGKSKLVVHHCMGLPLALKVLGSSLRGKPNDVWEDTMRKLAAIPDSKIQKVLQISYESLEEDTDKDLFLHISCFFEGENQDYIVKLLAKCDLYPVVGIKNLMDRCLLEVDQYGRVRMHQLIKEMGREVVRQESKKEPGKRSRLWHHQDCIDVLQDQSGTGNVQGLMIDMQKTEKAITMNNPRKRSLEELLGKRIHGNYANFKIGGLEKMKNLILLQLNYVMLSGKFKKLPRKLRLLRWHGCPLEAIPSDSCLEKLVVLDMSHSKLKRVWDDLEFTIGSLKILNLSYSVELTKTPDFRRLPGLESLILEGCSSLIKVDESIGSLKELVLLDLTDCKNLREFPFLPTSIVSLQMSGCGVCRWVQSLDFVPSLSHLRNMNISNCNLSDTFFPNEWSGLVSLVSVNINGNNVTSIPNCIRTLPIIKELMVGSCSKIQSILGLPESLKYLYVGSNESLEKVQVAQSGWTLVHHSGSCPKLCEIEGRYKVRSIDKVDRKIIHYLGLELNVGEGMELGLKVLHEFGIFSTCVSGKQIPSDFMYKARRPQISFQVPWHDDRLRISGFNMCVVLSQSSKSEYFSLRINVYNKTKNSSWAYHKGHQKSPKNVKSYAWLSLWRCGNLLEAGDEVFISIIDLVYRWNCASYRRNYGVDTRNWAYRRNCALTGGFHQDVEECGINLIYEVDDGEREEEEEEAHHVNAFDLISWTDRMDVDILDFVFSGELIEFDNDYLPVVEGWEGGIRCQPLLPLSL